MQLTFQTLGPALPGLAARLAEKLWMTPPRTARRQEEVMLLAGADRLPLQVDGQRVALYGWGTGPAVLLVHGWGGRGTQLGAFVPALREAGFRVVAFDAPGHGETPEGQPTLPLFARVIAAAASAVGGVEGIVAHSMGAPATALALHAGLEAKRVVFVSPAADMVAASQRFARALRIAPRVRDEMQRRLEQRLGFEWDGLKVPRIAPELRQPLLVIHDEADAEVPYGEGVSISRTWPGARLHTTDGLGHNRILRDPEVIRSATAFLTVE